MMDENSHPLTVCSSAKTAWLVCSHPLAAQYLKLLIQSPSSLQVIDHRQALTSQTSAGNTPRVIVLDICMLPLALDTFIRKLISVYPEAQLILLTHKLPIDVQLRCLSFGVRGFVFYEDVTTCLAQAIHQVHSRRFYVDTELLERFAEHVSSKSSVQTIQASLSDRELSIRRLLLQNMSNKEIALELNIGERTVKFHLSNIYRKMGVSDRRSAMMMVLANT